MSTIQIEQINNCALIHHQGDLTLEVIDQLKEELDSFITGQNCTCLIMDLSQTPFIDSSGIGFLVHLNNRKKSDNLKFFLFAPTEQILKTLKLVRLLSFFEILNDVEEIEALA